MQAKAGIENLKDKVDALIVIPEDVTRVVAGQAVTVVDLRV